MLEHLYKKLHLIFISSIMAIIIVVIGILCKDFLDNERKNDSIFFERLSMLMLYELENPQKSPQEVIWPYEDNYSIFAVLKDAQENVIYQSPFSFPTDITFLLKQFTEKADTESVTTLDQAMTTTQNGILSFSGYSHDNYWGIPANVVDKNGTLFYLCLLQRQNAPFELIGRQLPLYILLWFLTLFCVVIASRFLLKRAIAPTEKVLKSQKSFIAAASHELKAPLAVILANNDKINRLSDGIPDIQKAANIIDAETIRMSKLIKDMLLLASSDSGTRSLNKTMINIDTLLILLYEAYEPVCSQKGMPLDADFIDVRFPLLYTDRECLFQILSIFMDNAISHSKTQGLVQIKATLSRKAVTISVIDHGQGITAEDRPYIFDRFYCADKSHTDKSHFGLGLNIAKELAGFLSADVGVKDTEGGGATFFLTIPLKQDSRSHK